MRVFRITNLGQYTTIEFERFVEQNPEFKMVMEYKTYDPPQGEHWHGYTEEDISSQAVATRIKNALHCVGNQHYSISSKELDKQDPDGYRRYISKGAETRYPPSQFRNLSETDVLIWHRQYWDANQVIKEQRKSGKESQKDQLFEYCKGQLGERSDTDDLVQTILMFFRKEDKIVSNAQVENYYYYISCKLDDRQIVKRANSISNQIRQRG